MRGNAFRARRLGRNPTFSELNFGGYEGPDLPDPEFVLELWAGVVLVP